MAIAAALFQNDKEVERALDALEKSGFDPDSITVISKDTLGQSAPKVKPIPDAGAGGIGKPAAPGPAGAAVVRPASVGAALTAHGIPRGSAGFFEEAVVRGAAVVAVRTGLFRRRKARRALQRANGITAREGRKPSASEESGQSDRDTQR